MNIEVARLIADYNDGEVREDYSGRGMYGRETAGVVLDFLPESMDELLEGAEEDVEFLQEDGIPIPNGFSSDNMGMGYIIY